MCPFTRPIEEIENGKKLCTNDSHQRNCWGPWQGFGLEMYFAKVTVPGGDRTAEHPQQNINLQFCFENPKNFIKRIFIVSPEGRVVKSYKGANHTYPIYGILDKEQDVVKQKTFVPLKNNEIRWKAKKRGTYLIKYWIGGPGDNFFNIEKSTLGKNIKMMNK